MIAIPLLSKNSFFLFLVTSVLLVSVSFYNAVNPLLVFALLIWLLLFVFSIDNISHNIALFCFLTSFFVFLLGREVCFAYFGLELYYTNLMVYNDFTFLSLSVSLFGIGIGYILWNSEKKKNINNHNFERNFYLKKRIKFLKKIFCFSYIFLMILLIGQIIVVQTVGYLGSYTAFIEEAFIPWWISYIAAFCPVVFCLLLASMPSKREVLFPILMFEFYGILSLLTGKRFNFVGVTMLILIYSIKFEFNIIFFNLLKASIILALSYSFSKIILF